MTTTRQQRSTKSAGTLALALSMIEEAGETGILTAEISERLGGHENLQRALHKHQFRLAETRAPMRLVTKTDNGRIRWFAKKR